MSATTTPHPCSFMAASVSSTKLLVFRLDPKSDCRSCQCWKQSQRRYLEQGSAFQCIAEVLSLLRLRHQESREKILY